MSQAEHIISKFGTQEKLADALGCRQSVIAGWKKRGFVPANRHADVLAAAEKAGVEVAPKDFFPAQQESNSETSADCDTSKVQDLAAEFTRLLESAEPSDAVSDEIERLFVSGSMFTPRTEAGTGATDFVLRFEPSQTFLVLLAALRAGHLDLEVVKSLGRTSEVA